MCVLTYIKTVVAVTPKPLIFDVPRKEMKFRRLVRQELNEEFIKKYDREMNGSLLR